MLSTRTVSIVILLALSFTFDNAKAQDQSAQHSVYPLSRFQPGQWVEKVSGDFTKPGDPFVFRIHQDAGYITLPHTCLLYTSDAADERSSVDLGGRRIIKKKNH